MIASTDLKCNIANVIDSFEITWGSDSFVDMIQTPSISVTCLGWTANYGVMQAVGQTLTIEWQGWNLFAGTIRGITVEDEGNGVYIYRVDAEAPWTYLGMKSLGGNGYPAQTDSARIDQLLTEAGSYSWQDIDPNVTWATMTTAWYGLTWTTWGSTVDKIVGASTGTATYNFDAYPPAEESALTLLDMMSVDCRGRFYAPWSSGYLYWKAYTDVATLLAAPNFTIAGATEIIDGTLAASGSIAEIYNVVNLTDQNGNITGTADSTSIDIYGIRSLGIQTNLSAANRLPVATNILATAAQIRSNLTGFSIQTTGWSVARGQSFLIDCISGSIGAAAVTGIPAAFGGNQNVLITGGTMIYNQSTVTFDIRCQSANDVAAVQMWSQVDVSYTWATYLPNTIWASAA